MGQGIVSNSGNGTGYGLANTRARLSHLYGSAQEFSLRQLPEKEGGGVKVDIKIPFRESDKHAPDNAPRVLVGRGL